MRRKLLLFLAGILLLSGCAMAQVASKKEGSYQIYYLCDPLLTQGGDAVASESFAPPPASAEEMAKALMERMLAGPQEETLSCATPPNTKLLGLKISGPHAYVDLSAAYGTLSGIELTLADYCIVLTLTQLPEISVVSISVQGEPLAYRSTQNLTARDVLQSSSADVISTVEVRLYFVQEGRLTAEPRTLELYEGETQVGKLLAALAAGPQSKTLASALPEDFAILSAWVQDGTCYLNLPSAAERGMQQGAQTVDALVSSLCSLDSVQNVQMMVDGELRASFGGVSIEGLLQSDTEN